MTFIQVVFNPYPSRGERLAHELGEATDNLVLIPRNLHLCFVTWLGTWPWKAQSFEKSHFER